MAGDHGAGRAGRSAQEQADRRRRRAEQLQAQASKWEAGAEGERRTASALAWLPPSFVVFHDLPVPGSRANIDHLVIGPPGAFVIDSKHYDLRYPIWMGTDTLVRGRYPMRRELDTVRWEATQAATMLGRPVVPVLCLVNDNLEVPDLRVRDVVAANLSALCAVLTAMPPVLDAVEIGRLARLVSPTAGARPHVHAEVASAPPAPSEPVAPRRHRARTTRTAPTRVAATRSTRSGGSRRPRRSARRPSPGAVLARFLVAIVLLVVAVPALVRVGTRMQPSTTDVVTPGPAVTPGPRTTLGRVTTTLAATTSPPATAPPTTPPAPPVTDYACPGSGSGWTMTLRWPEHPDATAVRWSWRPPGEPVPAVAQLWTAGDPAPALAGIAPGTPTVVDIVVVTAAGETPPASAEHVAPAEPC